MKILGFVFVVALCLTMMTGCSGYSVQAVDNAEGNIWVAKGTTVWHCSAGAGTPTCKIVLD